MARTSGYYYIPKPKPREWYYPRRTSAIFKSPPAPAPAPVKPPEPEGEFIVLWGNPPRFEWVAAERIAAPLK